MIRKPSLITIILLWLIAAAAAAAEAWTWSEPAAHHAAVCLVTADTGPERSSGSGCYVQIGTLQGVLTARHCLGGQITIKWSDGSTTAGEPTTDKTGADLGFILASHAAMRPVPIATSAPAPGDWLEFAGFGGPRNQLRHWWGKLDRMAGRDQRGNSFADYDCAVMQGDSGGPIFNQHAEVVGVITVGGGDPFATVGGAYAFLSTGGPAYDVVSAFVGRVAQRYTDAGGCGPSGCPSPRGSSPGNDSWAYPPRPSPSPVPSPAPAPTLPVPGERSGVSPPVPSPPVPCPGIIYQVDYERLAAFLIPLLAADSKLRGPPGPTGPAGPVGPGATLTPEQTEQLYQRLYAVLTTDPRFRGPPGQSGQPDMAQLAAAVAAQLPPVRFQLLDAAGKVSQEQSKPLGEPIRLQLVPE